MGKKIISHCNIKVSYRHDNDKNFFLKHHTNLLLIKDTKLVHKALIKRWKLWNKSLMFYFHCWISSMLLIPSLIITVSGLDSEGRNTGEYARIRDSWHALMNLPLNHWLLWNLHHEVHFRKSRGGRGRDF